MGWKRVEGKGSMGFGGFWEMLLIILLLENISKLFRGARKEGLASSSTGFILLARRLGEWRSCCSAAVTEASSQPYFNAKWPVVTG